MEMSFWHFVLMLGLGSLVAGQTCVSDQDCPLTTSCQITTGQCVAEILRNCTSNTDCDVLQSCNATATVCMSVSCQSHTECSGQNTRCADTKYCKCAKGFTLRNGQCTNDLGRVCVLNTDCGASAVCNSGACQCNSYRGFYNDTGVCKHVIGEPCTTDSNCTKTSMYSVVCNDGACDCNEGYVLKNDYCQQILHSSCTNDIDCPMEYAECRDTCIGCTSTSHQCRCVAGTSQKSTNGKDACKKMIGYSCNDVSCSHHYGGYMPVYCDADYICSCPRGYTQDGNTSICIPVYGKSCTDTSDCGNSAIYKCESGNCTCIDSNLKQPTSYQYSYSTTGNSVQRYICTSVIGRACQQNLCEAANGTCDNYNQCKCKTGTVTNDGICVAVLDLPCTHDIWCSSLNYTRCGTSAQCECTEGYRRSGTECVRVLGSPCSTAYDCVLDHSTCGTDGVCECEGGYPQFGDRCLISACHVAVPVLPDINRRFQTYAVGTRNTYEHLIHDNTLAETWYSIGLHTLASSVNAPPIGRCGTYYPIYLKDPLTEQQKLTMESSEIAVTAMVGGLETEFGLTEDIEVKLRKCGDETLVYLKAPQTRISAYCLVSNTIRDDSHSQSSPNVQAHLEFYEDTINGNLMDVPYNYYECNYYPNSGNSQGVNGVAYAVNWYVDDNHIATYGPVSQFPAESTRLTDMVILEHGYKLGFTIRCSVQRASTFTGELFHPVYAWPLHTGVNEQTAYFDSTTNTTVHNPRMSIPLGCMAAVDDESLKCTLKFDVIDSSGNAVCPLTDTDRHPACGVSLVGLTKRGLHERGNNWLGHDLGYYNQTTGIYHYEYHGSLVQVDNNLNDASTIVAKLQHGGGTTGHRIWDEYEYPDIKVRHFESPFGGQQCSVGRSWMSPTETDGQDTVHKYNYGSAWGSGSGFGSGSGYNQDHVAFESDSEYILLRSTTHPVEIQMKTKVCNDTNVPCVCAVTIRNGHSIDTVDYCNAAPKIGTLYGPGTTGSSMNQVQLLNGAGVYINHYNGRLSMSVSGTLNETDGLCSFETDTYRWRDGTVAKSSSGFATSWKIPANESLLNPDNHISYGWNESFYLCHCPKSTFDVPNRLILSERNTQYYTGALKCTTDYKCTTSHTGEAGPMKYRDTYNCSAFKATWRTFFCEKSEGIVESINVVTSQLFSVWKPSLLPPYTIDTTTVSVDLVYNNENPELQLKCNFHSVNGYLYIIEWTMNGVRVLISDYLQASETDTFYLTDDYVIENTDVEFFLDIPIVCGVSVHSSNKEQLTNMFDGDPFYPIEILKTEINIVRGGDAVITLKQNMPFGCSPGPDCRLVFILYDPFDSYNCTDSTIAVKSRSTCGTEIKGAMSRQQVSVSGDLINIVITTKNNNKYSLRTIFTLKLRISVRGNGKAIYDGEFGQTFTVFVRDHGSWHHRVCYANNDPRMVTFDRVYYSMQLVGIFTMYRHTTLPLEIQMMTQPCNGGWASCSCGVAVRAGRDVYVINHCYGHHITGYLLDDDKILTVRRRSTTRYQIAMPHGTMVDVYVSPRRWYMVNINIYPSPTDQGKVDGLCGDFNGIRSDDLKHRDGTVSPLYGYYWYYNPTTFAGSWRIEESAGASVDQSLFNITGIKASLQSWSVDEQMCVCPGKGASVLCSANEEDTCTQPVNKRGIKLARKIRVERSTQSQLNYDYERRLESIHKRSAAARVVKRSTTQSTNISVENATEICREAMEKGCALFKMKNDTPSADPEETVRNCGRDLAINPSIEWAGESCARFQAEVDTELERDVVFKENKTEATAKITAQNCIYDCYNHGTCINGTCSCDPGYANDDCSQDLSQAPEIITDSLGACNPKTDGNCDCMLIVTNGNVENATCKVTEYKAGTDGKFVETSDEVTPAEYENYNEMFCCKTTSRNKRSVQGEATDDASMSTRSKRSTGSSDVVLGTRVYIIVSNNGVNFSSGVYIDVLDPTCQEYVTTTNGDTIALLKTGYCFINGDCFSESTVNPTASCEKCDTSKATYAWTDDGCSASNGAPQQSPTSSDDGLKTVDIILITLGIVIVLTLVIGLVVFVHYKSKRAGVQPNPSEPQPLDNYTRDFQTVDNNRKPVFAWNSRKE